MEKIQMTDFDEAPGRSATHEELVYRWDLLRKGLQYQVRFLESLIEAHFQELCKKGIIYTADDPKFRSFGRNIAADFKLSKEFYFCKEENNALLKWVTRKTQQALESKNLLRKIGSGLPSEMVY